MPPASAASLLLPPGLVAFVKRDCPTCELVAPVLRELAQRAELRVYTQDDPAFPPGLEAIDDTSLERSWHCDIEAVPTLIRVGAGGREEERALGWHRGDWEKLTGISGLGEGLPDYRPGCGSRSVDPNLAPELAIRFGASDALGSRRITLGEFEDEIETARTEM